MKIKDVVQGKLCKLKDKPLYGTMKIHRLIPKKGSNTTYQLVEVLHSSTFGEVDWNFALIKWFKVSDLELI